MSVAQLKWLQMASMFGPNKKPPEGGFLFDNSGFFESSECAVFCKGAHTASRDAKSDRLFELRDINLLFLKIWIFTIHSCRIEFRCTSAV